MVCIDIQVTMVTFVMPTAVIIAHNRQTATPHQMTSGDDNEELVVTKTQEMICAEHLFSQIAVLVENSNIKAEIAKVSAFGRTPNLAKIITNFEI